jgi:three-Cys-motif partner protein
MPDYLAPGEDGLIARDSGEWAEEKLDYLARYIWVFETSMHSQPWRERHYIDLLAGPGKCRVERTGQVLLGSPLIALTTEHPFTDYFFVDIDHENVEALQQRCSHSAVAQTVTIKQGDCNVIVDEIVQHVKSVDSRFIKGVRSSLNLAFLDPEGFELRWKTVAKLASVYAMDMIINFPIGGLNRFMPIGIEQEYCQIDDFFGGTEWRQIYHDHIGRRGMARALLDLYKSKLTALGYKDVRGSEETGDEVLIRNTQRQAPLYYLMFACKHPLGNEFWKGVTRRNVRGQRTLL